MLSLDRVYLLARPAPGEDAATEEERVRARAAGVKLGPFETQIDF